MHNIEGQQDNDREVHPSEEESGVEAQQESYESMEHYQLHVANEVEAYIQKREAGLRSKFEPLRERAPEKAEEAEGILTKLRESTLQKVVRPMMLSMSLLGAAGAAQAEADYEDWPDISEFSEQERERVLQDALERLDERVWSDEGESLMDFYGREGSLVQINEIDGEDNVTKVEATYGESQETVLKVEEIHEKDTGRWEQLKANITGSKMTHVRVHNHPLSLGGEVVDYPPELEERIANGERVPVTMPPSAFDVLEQPHFDLSLDKKGYVVEPSGEWLVDYDEEHRIIQVRAAHMRALLEDTRAFVYTYALTQPEALAQLEEQYVAGADKTLGEIFSGAEGPLVDQLNELVDRWSERQDEALGPQYQQNYDRFLDLAQLIRTESVHGNDVSELIEEYIAVAAEMGVNITYTPRAKME